MKTKKYNKLIIYIVSIVILLTVAINYITDPFDIFTLVKKQGFNYDKPCISKQERMTKIPQLKLNKEKIDTIFVGSSKTQWWLDTDYHSKLSGKKVITMGLSSASIQECIIMAENSILIHPEIQKIYFGLDFFSFSSNFFDTSVNVEKITDRNITKKELVPLLLSFDTLKYSIQTISKNMFKQKTNEKPQTVNNPKAEHYFKESIKKYDRDYYSDYALNKKAFESLVKFSDFAKSKNVEVIYFITPTHITDIINIKEHGLINIYYQFKRELAQKFNYYDLSIINEYNTEYVTPDIKYFRDAVHASSKLGEIFAENFYIKRNNSAVYITKDNVDDYIKTDMQNLNKYINANPQIVRIVKEYID